jgi:hypothetical protein
MNSLVFSMDFGKDDQTVFWPVPGPLKKRFGFFRSQHSHKGLFAGRKLCDVHKPYRVKPGVQFGFWGEFRIPINRAEVEMGDTFLKKTPVLRPLKSGRSVQGLGQESVQERRVDSILVGGFPPESQTMKKG